MAEQTNGQEQAQQVDVGNPNCPNCKRELITFQGKIITMSNGFLCSLLWCPNQECKTLLSMTVVGMAESKQPKVEIIPPGAVPRLVRKQ